VDVRKVTHKVIDRELTQIITNLTKQFKAGTGTFDYRGTVGISRKTIIINLPIKWKALVYCVVKLKVYVETIIGEFVK